MLASRLTLVVLLSMAIFADRAVANDSIEDLLAATFRITDQDHSGTCFLISGKAVNSKNPREVLLVTANHVLAQMARPHCDLILRKEAEDGRYARRVFPVQIRDGDKPRWVTVADVDVATLRFELPEDVFVKTLELDQIADEKSLKEKTVRVGQEAWICCYPAKLEANDGGWAVLRKGSLASYPLVPLKAHKTMMIDYSAFGGDSGAPVAVLVNDRVMIVGIASGMHLQTDRSVVSFEERIMHMPLGLSISTQAALLREAIERMRVE